MVRIGIHYMQITLGYYYNKVRVKEMINMHAQCLHSYRNAICVMYRYISLGHKCRLIWESCITCICNVFKRQNDVTPSNNGAV